MAILQANPADGLEDIDEDSYQEESTEYNFRELYDQVTKYKDVIITVPADQVQALKQGLVIRKSKDNAKLTKSGLLPDNLILAFLAYPSKDKNGNELAGTMDVRVKLRPKRGVTVLDIRIPDDL